MSNLRPTETDLSTIFSLFPLAIEESKPGLNPGNFKIPAGSMDMPAELLVGPATFNVYTRDGQSIPTRTSSFELATSLVNDFKSSQLGIGAGMAPGLICYPGRVSVGAFLTDSLYAEDRIKLVAEHKAWLVRLVRLADGDWLKYHSHNAVGLLQRTAANILGITDKEWLLADSGTERMKSCPACYKRIDSRAIVCEHCRAILDREAFKQFQVQ